MFTAAAITPLPECGARVSSVYVCVFVYVCVCVCVCLCVWGGGGA